ncbi:NAD-dependent epimerase/dehydratase family protein [uncultured Maribacter sp.]|uniref:NAD-dependent epimerase/dehydratase family protein n=1 Tax=uncultured Maribacter sp. TaxID=431308 RepID=UPI00261694E7|nr:NAD-dependent epimerase/dehydratase family protein [uncultured Maribacter sp.]
MKKNILVTGSAGFIGFHLVKTLLHDETYNIVGIDNINDYYDVNLKLSRLKEIGIEKENINEDCSLSLSSKNSNYRFGKIDITNAHNLEILFKKENFDYVIHLAAQAGVRYSIENPSAYIQTNMLGYFNVLECCRNYKINHFVYASSSSVYGGNKKVPFSEEDKVDNPVSLYAATKKGNELMAYTYSHLFDFRTTGLRFFTVYGPWGRPDMAPMLFANAICKSKPIKVFNNGDMLRDFTYIDDIVDGVIKCLNFKTTKIPKAEIFNIGNSKPINLMEFIETLEIAINRKSERIMMPIQPGDVKVTYADTTKLKDTTGYNPKTEIKQGVKNFIDWYKEYYKLSF